MQPGSSPNGDLDMPSRTTWCILTPSLVVSGLLLAAGLSGLFAFPVYLGVVLVAVAPVPLFFVVRQAVA